MRRGYNPDPNAVARFWASTLSASARAVLVGCAGTGSVKVLGLHLDGVLARAIADMFVQRGFMLRSSGEDPEEDRVVLTAAGLRVVREIHKAAR